MKSTTMLLALFLVACGDLAGPPEAVTGKGDWAEDTCAGFVSIGVCLHPCADESACADAPEGPVCKSMAERRPEWMVDANTDAPRYQDNFLKVCGCDSDADCRPGKICDGLLSPHCVDRCETLDDCKGLFPGYVHCDSSSGRCLEQCPQNLKQLDGACAWECPAGLTDCGGVCVDLATNPDHCGACGIKVPDACNL